MKYQSVFPDRNGTIGGDGHFIHPRDFEPYTNFYQASLSQKTQGSSYLPLRSNTGFPEAKLPLKTFLRSFPGWIRWWLNLPSRYRCKLLVPKTCA
jgi:hypothetical protein